MDEQEWLAERFEEHRTHLRAVAYRMLGSLSEADDAVQEAWLRLSRSDAGEIENLGGWLTTVVARVSLNMLRSRATRREEPLGVHIPDPIVDPADGTDPEHEALLADSVGLALLVVLETLSPRRAARVRAARHVRRSVRRDRADRRALARGDAPAREPRPPTGAGRAHRSPTPTSTASARSSTRSSPPPATATSTRSSPCSTPTWCCAPTSAAADAGTARRRGGREPAPGLLAAGPRRPPGADQRRRRRGHDTRRSPVLGRRVTVRDGRIVEMDFLSDPERLARLDLTVLDG